MDRHGEEIKISCYGKFLSNLWTSSDPPTADKEGLFIVCSFAASRKLPIQCADLESGYFQGERLSKPYLLRQPAGGLPDPSVKADDRMLAFVPIYGTRDAGRGLGRKCDAFSLSKASARTLFCALRTHVQKMELC